VTATQAHVAIIGGGITGLAAAYFLQEAARERGRPLAITVLEASHRLGGKILTERVDGYCIEAGPDSFLARKPWARQLAERVGLGEDLVPIDPRHRRTFVLKDGQLHPIPEGLFMFVPLTLGGLVRSRLFTPWGKARMALEPLVPKGPAGDESIGAFVSRRVGKEALERLAEPLLTGIFAGRAERLSIMATFPQLKEVEQRAGSLWRGLRRGRRPSGSHAAAAAGGHGRGGAEGSGAPTGAAKNPVSGGEDSGGSAFLALRGGLESLVEALVRRMDAVRLRTGLRVTGLSAASGGAPPETRGNPAASPQAPAGAPGRYTLTLADGTSLDADVVIVTVPAFAAAELLAAVCPEAVPHLKGIRFVSVTTCALGFDRADVDHPLNGSGFLVPSREGRAITACTWVSSKWAHAARPDQVLIRCYLGRDGEQRVMELSDGEVVELVRRELRELMGLAAVPRLARVYRWERAMPQYEVGHLDRIAELERALARHPGLLLAGASYRGVGVPDCIRQGQLAAEQALALL